MATMRDRVAGQDSAAFVGRTGEMGVLERVLAGSVPWRVVHVVGPGGIGKSALIRRASRSAGAHGMATVWIDGRDVAPFPEHLDDTLRDAIEAAADRPAFVVFDSYELMSSLDSHLRDDVIPELPESTIVVFGTREPPNRGWGDHGWDAISHTIRLGPLGVDDAIALARSHGAVDDVDQLVRRSRGSPLALVVGAELGPGDTPAALADRLLGEEVDPGHLRVLGVAAIARVTTPELLEDVLGDGDAPESFKWLASRSFSEPLATGVALHALVADAVRAQLRARDAIGEAELRRRIADHLHRRALAGHRGISRDLQHLVVDPDVKWGFAADVGNRYHIDSVRPGDAEHIGELLASVGVGEWWSITKVFFDDHPEYCGVARDADGRIGGYYVAVSPAGAPAAAERDPVLAPWLAHARHALGTHSAVLWREAIDLTGAMGEVTSLLGAGGLLSTGVPNPRFGFLPISPLIPAALQFSRALGAAHVPELDVHTHGQELECHVVDFGPQGLLGFQRDWIYRETGASPPLDAPEIDPVEIVKLLRDPDRLAHGPSWLGSSPSARLARVRELVERSLVAFGDHRDDRLAREIVDLAYLDDSAPHDAIARRLHLSRSAYFRRLHAATERVGVQLAALLRGDP